MERFVQTLVTVVEANQRFLMGRLVVQCVLVIAAGVGLWKLSGWMWWLCLLLFLFLAFGAFIVGFQLKLHLTMKLEPPWRAIGLQPPQTRSREQVLELHLLQGGITLVAVRADLVEGVLSAAREAGLEVITETEALKALAGGSKRIERLHDIEVLLPFVPTPELRDEISAALPRASDELLREIEILLMAEKDAQTTTSLRGPKPVFEKELRAKLGQL
jgi:hypothetical protein